MSSSPPSPSRPAGPSGRPGAGHRQPPGRAPAPRRRAGHAPLKQTQGGGGCPPPLLLHHGPPVRPGGRALFIDNRSEQRAGLRRAGPWFLLLALAEDKQFEGGEMRPGYQRKAVLWGAPGLIFHEVGYVGSYLTAKVAPVELLAVVGLAGLLGTVALMIGFAYYANGKGRSTPWCLHALIGLFGG